MMTPIEIQNSINQTEALINEIDNSSLYSEDEKKQLMIKYQTELEKLYLKKAENLEVKTDKNL
jgi:hypothetical protein